jgi:tetratricopeptide (TPR) repeat protein
MSRSLRETFEKISSTKNFELLDPYRNSVRWKKLGDEDKYLLAKMFVMAGEEELEKGEASPVTSFELSKKLCPSNSELLLEQAIAYALHGSNIDNLILACRTAEQACTADSDCYQALTVWANAMVELGVKKEEPDYFYEANDKYRQVSLNSRFQKNPEPHFYWYWGVCWHYIAKQSGEAGDFVEAISKYQKAEALKLTGTMFWNDYGNALVDLACLVSREDLLTKASNLYQKVVDSSPSFFEGWFNLACTDQRLWQLKGEDRYFYTAHKSFDQASKLNPDEASLWFKWAEHLSKTGKDKQNPKLLEASLDKFLKANTLLPDHAPILSNWAETQMLIGVFKERLDYLKWAEVIIQRCLELEPENNAYWVVYGRCLIELGRYFEDAAYFNQAIEKFKYGISLHKSNPDLWYGLASAHHILGEIKDNAALVENSVKYYSRATEFEGNMPPAFWNEWGVALMRMGEMTQDKRWVEAASEKFEQSIRLYHLRHNPRTINPDWLYNYGCSLDFLGDFSDDEKYYERAIKVLSQTLAVDADHYHAKYHLAMAFSHLGELVSDVDCFQKSLEIFQEVLMRDPEDDTAWNEWGIALINLAELVHDPVHSLYTERLMKEAEEKFIRAGSLGNEAAYYNLACLYSLQGNYQAAMHYIERAELAGALPPLEELIHDEWLRDLRSTNGFQQFLKHLARKNSEL